MAPGPEEAVPAGRVGREGGEGDEGGVGLDLREDALKLTIYFGERDRWDGRPLSTALVELLRNRGLWGCTVTRGLIGFGKRSVLHAALPLRLSEDLPLVLVAVDAERKVQAVLPEVERMVRDGLITLEPVRVVRHVG